jgi:APA family basic amino acid/polyamine antiporter
LKRRPGEPDGRFEIPIFVPAIGCILCVVLIIVRVATGDILAPLIAGLLIAGILVVYWLSAPKANAPQV